MLKSKSQAISNAIEKKVAYHQTIAKYFFFLFGVATLVSIMGIALMVVVSEQILLFVGIIALGLFGMIETTLIAIKHNKKDRNYATIGKKRALINHAL